MTAETPLRIVLSRLRAKSLKVAKSGGKAYVAQCPAHDDQIPSLSVSEGMDGRVLLNCHTGCTTENVVDALGLSLADLFVQCSKKGRRPIVATYPYHGADGELLFEAVRFEPKTFRLRRPDRSGGWTWNLKGVKRVPYRLPELLEAVNEGRTICIVEGEKDVDNLADRNEIGHKNKF